MQLIEQKSSITSSDSEQLMIIVLEPFTAIIAKVTTVATVVDNSLVIVTNINAIIAELVAISIAKLKVIVATESKKALIR